MKLLGVEVVFCGLKSIVAQTMTKAGIYFNEFGVYKNLEIAFLVPSGWVMWLNLGYKFIFQVNES